MSARRRVAAMLAGLGLLATACGELPTSSADTDASSASADLGAASSVHGAVYAERDTGPLRLDLFLPKQSAQPLPVVVYVHGGSWAGGQRALDGKVAEQGRPESLAAQRLIERGYAVATVDYRLSGTAVAPAQLIDVADAVRWLQEHGAQWNLDPERVALWGASAGGQLVALAGAVADGSGPIDPLPGIRAVVNWFGPSDMTPEAAQGDPSVADEAIGAVAGLLGCDPRACPEQAAASSPVKNLSGDEPPFLLQHGTMDKLVPVEQSLDFAAALRDLGGTVEVHPYEGLDHGFVRQAHRTSIVDSMTAFLDTHLR